MHIVARKLNDWIGNNMQDAERWMNGSARFNQRLRRFVPGDGAPKNRNKEPAQYLEAYRESRWRVCGSQKRNLQRMRFIAWHHLCRQKSNQFSFFCFKYMMTWGRITWVSFTGLFSSKAPERPSGKKEVVYLVGAAKFELEIIGVEHYQDALETICGPRVPRDVKSFEAASLKLEDKTPRLKCCTCWDSGKTDCIRARVEHMWCWRFHRNARFSLENWGLAIRPKRYSSFEAGWGRCMSLTQGRSIKPNFIRAFPSIGTYPATPDDCRTLANASWHAPCY